MQRTCIFCKHFEPLYTIRCISLTCLPPKPPLRNFNPSHVHSKCRLITGSRLSLKRTCFAGQAYEIPSHHPSLLSHLTAKPYLTPRTLCPPANTFATLVSRSMQHSRRAALHDGTRVRDATARVAVGDRNRLAVLVQRVIKRLSTSSQVFRRNMWGKQRRMHRFSAFWVRSSV